jgi:hypothetical protein
MISMDDGACPQQVCAVLPTCIVKATHSSWHNPNTYLPAGLAYLIDNDNRHRRCSPKQTRMAGAWHGDARPTAPQISHRHLLLCVVVV